MISHIVLMTLFEPTDRAEVLSRLRALRGQIPTLVSLRCGTDCVAAPGSADIVLITEHDDAAGLAAYNSHPVHSEFVTWVKPRLSARTAVDADDLC